MATTLTLWNNSNRQPGTYSFGPSSIPANVSHVTIKALRDSWPTVDGDLIILAADISFDAGETWQLLGAFSAPGGNLPAPGGGFAQYTEISVGIPQVGNPARRVRAVLTCTATFRTTVTAEIS